MNPKATPAMPQIWRDHIARGMAFPVGYEFLQEHFGVPVKAAETVLWFRAHPTTFASKFAEVLRQAEPYPILCVERRSQSRHKDQKPAHWQFSVHPVESRLRSVARAALEPGAVAELRHFLARCPTHSAYDNYCIALFDPAEGTCKMEQLHPFR